ncbi:MAG: hypothetical protein HQK75_00470 [Candidatus Magnetomorum sp.]|nr:hypothetical protein [Candidatus Magnetomorum sp.]
MSYKLTNEYDEIETLLNKGLSIESKLKQIKQEMDAVNTRIIKLAMIQRKNKQATVNFQTLTGKISVVFRETYQVKDNEKLKECKKLVGSLFDNLFTFEKKYKPKPKFKKFMRGETFGLQNYDKVKLILLDNVEEKTIKPTVKFEVL